MLLKEKRSTTGAVWEERQTTRQMGMETCSKALAILSSDDAHTLFTKTFNPSFMQTNIDLVLRHLERQNIAVPLRSKSQRRSRPLSGTWPVIPKRSFQMMTRSSFSRKPCLVANASFVQVEQGNARPCICIAEGGQ